MEGIIDVRYQRSYTIQRIEDGKPIKICTGSESVAFYDPRRTLEENDLIGGRLVMDKIREQERVARRHHGPNIHFIPDKGERVVTLDITKKFEQHNE